MCDVRVFNYRFLFSVKDYQECEINWRLIFQLVHVRIMNVFLYARFIIVLYKIFFRLTRYKSKSNWPVTEFDIWPDIWPNDFDIRPDTGYKKVRISGPFLMKTVGIQLSSDPVHRQLTNYTTSLLCLNSPVRILNEVLKLFR